MVVNVCRGFVRFSEERVLHQKYCFKVNKAQGESPLHKAARFGDIVSVNNTVVSAGMKHLSSIAKYHR